MDEMMRGGDVARSSGATDAMLKMVTLDIAALEEGLPFMRGKILMAIRGRGRVFELRPRSVLLLPLQPS